MRKRKKTMMMMGLRLKEMTELLCAADDADVLLRLLTKPFPFLFVFVVALAVLVNAGDDFVEGDCSFVDVEDDGGDVEKCFFVVLVVEGDDVELVGRGKEGIGEVEGREVFVAVVVVGVAH